MLAGLLFLAGSATVFSTTQAHLPKDGIAHSGLGSLTSVSNQEHAPQTCSQGGLMEAILQFPSCQVCLGLNQVDKTRL